MTFPEDFLAKLREAEGFSPSPFWDFKQSTIGYGTRAKPGETSISRDEAESRFQDALGKARALVTSRFPNLPENQTLALTDLTYNAGPGWMNQGLGQAIAGGNMADAERRFRSYVNAGGKPLAGLAERRGWGADLLAGRMALGGPAAVPESPSAFDPATGQAGPKPLAMLTDAGRISEPQEAVASATPGMGALDFEQPDLGGNLAAFANHLGKMLEANIPRPPSINAPKVQAEGPRVNLDSVMKVLERRRKRGYGIS